MKLLLTNANSKGQVVIPKPIRDKLNIDEETVLSVEVEGERIVIQAVKYIDFEDPQKTYKELVTKTKGSWSDNAYLEYQQQRAGEKELINKEEITW